MFSKFWGKNPNASQKESKAVDVDQESWQPNSIRNLSPEAKAALGIPNTNAPVEQVKLEVQQPVVMIHDWKRIDQYEDSVKWQKEVARMVCHLSTSIACSIGAHRTMDDKNSLNGQDWSYNSQFEYWTDVYEDDVVLIKYDGGTKWVNVTTKSSIEVFMGGYSTGSDYGEYFGLRTFRVGSWIDHLESLQPRVAQGLKDRQIAKEAKEAQWKQQQFGRLD